jgi:hypothetical protein
VEFGLRIAMGGKQGGYKSLPILHKLIEFSSWYCCMRWTKCAVVRTGNAKQMLVDWPFLGGVCIKAKTPHCSFPACTASKPGIKIKLKHNDVE